MTAVAPEYEVTEICTHDGRTVRTVRTCLHANDEPVTSVTGEVVARLCLDCDRQSYID